MSIYIPLALAAIIAVFLVFVALQPSAFHVTRTTMISAPASAAFALVNDFHEWEKWSPYEKLDPTMKKTFAGGQTGIGAVYTWSGNANVGDGRTTITESCPSELIRIKLEMMRPFAGTNDVEFSFMPDGKQTAVTWSISGNYSFVPKAFGLFMNMDKMMGVQFETGLAQLKAVVESASQE